SGVFAAPGHFARGRVIPVGKRAKIPHADTCLRRVAHACDVERLLHPPDVRLGERRAAPRELIQVAARDGVVPRVKTVRHLRRREDVDVGRQLVVQPPAQRVGRQIRADVEMRHLRERVHAGVGPARSVQLEVLAPGDRADSAVDFTLHRLRVLLDLPAAVACAGVLDRQLEAWHARIVSWAGTATGPSSAPLKRWPTYWPFVGTAKAAPYVPGTAKAVPYVRFTA